MDANAYLQNLSQQMFNRPLKLPQLIGLHGKAGAGKDTLAAHLVASYNFASYALASPIKNMISVMLDVSGDMWDDRTWKEAPLGFIAASPRVLAQTLGTDWGRDIIDKQLWLKLLQRRWEASQHQQRGLVVTDVRFENEAEYIRSLGGVVAHIKRSGAGAVADHRSEAGIRRKRGDVLIQNDGSIADLYLSGVNKLQEWANGAR